MGNVITGLLPDITKALGLVGREQTGFLNAAYRNADAANGAAKGQTVKMPKVTPNAAIDITPAASPPTGYHTVGSADLTLDKARAYTFSWEGENAAGLQAGGIYASVYGQQFEHGFRVLRNEVENDLAVVAMAACCRAYGTAGTTPFATAGNMTDLANIRQLLLDNGTPDSNLRLVLNGSAYVNLTGLQSQLFKANEAGSDDLLRRGVVTSVLGLGIGQSPKLVSHTKGTGTNYQTNNAAGYAIGATSIALDTGSGTVLAGDIVGFAGDSNKYQVKTALAGGVIVLNEPGLRQTLADNVAMTIGNTYTPSVAFLSDSLQVAARPPRGAMMADGTPADLAEDVQVVADPITGLPFRIAVFKGYHQLTVEVGLVWGVTATHSPYFAALLG